MYLCCFFVFAGYVLSKMGLKQLDNYIETPAFIITSHIEKKFWKSESGTSRVARSPELYWIMMIQYEYVINDQKYVSNEVSNNIEHHKRVSESENTPNYMIHLIEKYKQNTKTTAFVRPDKYDETYLIINKQMPNKLAWLSLGLFIMASLFLIISKTVLR